jgi:hypothetical protein
MTLEEKAPKLPSLSAKLLINLEQLPKWHQLQPFDSVMQLTKGFIVAKSLTPLLMSKKTEKLKLNKQLYFILQSLSNEIETIMNRFFGSEFSSLSVQAGVRQWSRQNPKESS